MKARTFLLAATAVLLLVASNLGAVLIYRFVTEGDEPGAAGQEEAATADGAPVDPASSPEQAVEAEKPVPGPMPLAEHLQPPKSPPPIPDNPNASAPLTDEERKARWEKSRAGLFCASAKQAGVANTTFLVAQKSTPKLGEPAEAGPRVGWGGFPVVALPVKSSLNEVDFEDRIRKEAVKQSVCTWAAPLIEIQPAIAGGPNGFDKVQNLRVLLPVAESAEGRPPLESGTVPAGTAFVGKPLSLLKLQPADVSAFLAEVRASGARPKGPLLCRLETVDTWHPDLDMIRLIQPLETP